RRRRRRLRWEQWPAVWPRACRRRLVSGAYQWMPGWPVRLGKIRTSGQAQRWEVRPPCGAWRLLYWSSLTFSIHSTFLPPAVPVTARWVIAVFGEAPCQCLTPGGHHTKPPGSDLLHRPPPRLRQVSTEERGQLVEWNHINAVVQIGVVGPWDNHQFLRLRSNCIGSFTEIARMRF